jgi:signal transduction histidine kinase
VTAEQQAIYLNAVPLLVLGVAYLAAGLSLMPVLVRSRGAIRELELALALVFPCVGVAAIVFGLLVVHDREPVGGNGWPGFVAVVLAFVPVVGFFVRFRERALILTAPRLARTAEELGRLRGAETLQEAARAIAERTCELVRVELGAVATIEEGTRTAHGVVLLDRGEELEWFRDVVLDLDHEPSGIASAYNDAAAFAVYDAHASKRVSQRLVDRSGVESVAYVPILAAQQVVAVLVAGSIGRKHAFGTDDLSRLQALAAEAGPVLERLRSRHSGAREVAVARLAEQVRTDADLDAVLARTMQEVAAAFDAERCFVRLGDPEGEVSLKAQWIAEGLEPLDGTNIARLAVSNLAMRRGTTIAISDVATSSALRAAGTGPQGILEMGSRAVLATPVRVFGDIIGVLSVHRLTPGAWSDADVAFIEALSAELGLGIHTAQLFVQNERRLEIQRGFYRIATVLGQPLSLAATLDALAQAAGEAFGGSFTAVVMPRAGALHVAGAHGLPDSLRTALDEGLAEEGDALRLASAERRILASTDVVDDERFAARWRKLGPSNGFRSLLVVPLESRDEKAGLVLVFFDEEWTLGDDDLELARHLAGAGRGALERSALFEAERTSRSLAQQLARTGSVLATELDPAAVLDEVVEQAPALLGADACAIRIVENGDLVVTAAAGVSAEAALGARSDAAGPLSGEVAQSRRAVAVPDAAADPALFASDALLPAGFTAYLGVPLVGPEGALHGVMAVYGRRPRSWRTEEIDALVALAVNTSAALSNAELYQRVALEKERSSAILENIADGIVAVDREGDVVLWNRAAEQATGVPASEALGRNPQQILGRSLSGSAVVPIGRPGGETLLSVTEAVMRDPAGVVAGRIFAFRDVSADRAVEEMKSEFVSTVSHELRGPLTSIYGFAETLLREDVLFADEDRKTFLGYITSESERLTRIVDALLSVARLDAGDLQVNLRATDVQPLVTDVVSNVKENGGGGHRFVLDLPTEPLAAEADAEKLRQVLSHLVDNAVKYSPEGGRVTVAARRKSDTVEFQVADEGNGIPPAERERIFRKFYRVDAEGGGTGLGLFLAQGYVKAMGGRIRVESDEGQGSRFAFELPVARVLAGGSRPL